MLNKKDKELFLKIADGIKVINLDSTYDSYSRIFNQISKFEEKNKKDLYDFNLSQIDEYLTYKNFRTKASSRSVGRMMTKYIQWGIDSGKSQIKYNPLNVKQSYFDNFVWDDKSLFLSMDDIRDIMDNLINDQDAVIIAMLFNGVQGKGLSEMRNLKISDIDSINNTLKLEDESKGERILDLKYDELNLIKCLKMANKEERYIKKNGENEYNPRVKDYVELPTSSETKYILKSGNTNKSDSDSISKFTIQNRLEMIRTLDWLEDYKDKLTTKNIVKSGMIYHLYNLTNKGEITISKKLIEKTCEHFNINYTWAIKDFLNNDTINSLYKN